MPSTPNNTTRRKSILVTEALDIIDQDNSGDLGIDEVGTLLAAMGMNGTDAEHVLSVVFDGCSATSHTAVTDAILMFTSVGERELEAMLNRVAMFQKAFRKIDVNGDSKLKLNEVVWMMESLSIDKKLAADLMAFLDEDDSGDVTWVEFVRGVSNGQFHVLFPEITLEALVAIPSSLRTHKIIGAEEEAEAINNLPVVEKSLYWMLSFMYGRSAPPVIADEDESNPSSPDSCLSPNIRPSMIAGLMQQSATDDGSGLGSSSSSSDSEDTTSTSDSDHNANTNLALELPSMVRSQKDRSAVVIVRKDAKDPQQAQLAKVRRGKNPVVVTRKFAKNPDAVQTALVQPKLPVDLAVARPVRSPPHLAMPRPAFQEPDAEQPQKQVQFSPSLQQPSRMGRRQSVVGAMTNMLQGWKFGTKQPTMSLADAVSSMRSMEVKEKNKAHVLTEAKRTAMWRCAYGAVLAGILAGVGAAFFAQALNDFTSTIVDEEEDWLAWTTIACTFSLIWSLAEMVVCCVAALVAAVKMTRICGILLVPMDKERAILAGSLARAALELGHPRVRTFGIDPHKRASKFLLLLYALIYMGSRGITKFVIKLVVKKVAPRTLLKFMEMAPLVIEILINVLFNCVTVRYAMNEVIVCALGPSATVEVTSQLIKGHRKGRDVEEPLSDELKLLALRAVGVSITYKMQMHPNSRCLLDYVVELFVDEGFVRRAKANHGHMMAEAQLRKAKSGRSAQKTKSKGTASTEGGWCKGCCGSAAQKEEPAESLHEELAELGLDDEDLFFDGLAVLDHRDALFACSMLFLALMLDGRIGGSDWAFIERAARTVEPPLKAKWLSAVHLMNIYCSGRQMTCELFHDIFESSMDGEASSATCCDFFSGGMRSVTEYSNCC